MALVETEGRISQAGRGFGVADVECWRSVSSSGVLRDEC
jgi:hypothetical protein